jgi:16S rRNA G527 N7-methylase RsmG
VKQAEAPEAVRTLLQSSLPSSDTEAMLNSMSSFIEILLKHASRWDLLSASQRNPESIWSHIYDSLQLLALPSIRESRLSVDVGSGGGLPGIPLAIALPAATVWLVERSSAKAEFLELARTLIPVPNVEVHGLELKSLSRNLDSSALIISRATVQPENWPLLMRKSRLNRPWIIFSTEKNREAWESAAKQCDMMLKATHNYSLAGTTPVRSLLEFHPA